MAAGRLALWAPFVVAVGTGFLAWSGLRERLLPGWLGVWGMACGAAAFLQLFGGLWKPLRFLALGAGPPHMLWFALVGVTLLLRRPAVR